MEHQVEQRQQRGQHVAVQPEHHAQETGEDAHEEVEAQAVHLADAHHQRPLAYRQVALAVAEVVDQQQPIDDQPAGQRGPEHLPRDGVQLYVIGDADGHDAEEQQHQQVAQSEVAEVSGVEEAEHDAEQTDEYHLEAAIRNQRQAHDAGRAGGQGNGALHGVERHPPLGTGSARAQTGLDVIVAVGVVEEVVDEVGVHLHDKRKEEAEDGSHPAERSLHILGGIDIGQCHTYHYRHSSARQRLRTGCQEPRTE